MAVRQGAIRKEDGPRGELDAVEGRPPEADALELAEAIRDFRNRGSRFGRVAAAS